MTKKSNADNSRPFQRIGRSYPEELKKRLVQEVESGRLSQRAIERTYKINRKTIDSWITQFSLLPLNRNGLIAKPMKEPNENSKIKRLSKQVLELQKALEKANLKIDGLETLIQVSEEELKIKIRKKHGAKSSTIPLYFQQYIQIQAVPYKQLWLKVYSFDMHR